MGNKVNKTKKFSKSKISRLKKSIRRKCMELKKNAEEVNGTSCFGENAMIPQYYLSHQGEISNIYYSGAVQSPTTRNNQETFIYIAPDSETNTDWQAETNKAVEQLLSSNKIQSQPSEVPEAGQPALKPEQPALKPEQPALKPEQPALKPEQPALKPEPVKTQSTRKPRAKKKPKEDSNLLIKRTSKRLRPEPNSNPKQSNDTKEDFTNEFDVFGRFVALQLKSLSEEDALLAQSEIQEVLIRYRLNKIKTRYEVPIESVPSDIQSKQPGSESEVTTVEDVLVMKCEPESE